jgi:ABC-type cobalamin/Fe3+-siderophores transport system ATPase subunit
MEVRSALSIRIHVEQQYKSITPMPDSPELPNFVVLSGLNGSGKTQLLEAINRKTARVIDTELGQIEPARLYSHETLAPRDSSPMSDDQANQRVNEVAAWLTKLRERRATQPGTALHTIVNNPKVVRQINALAAFLKKEAHQITDTEVHRFARYFDDDEEDPFSANVSKLFKRYHDRKLYNSLFRLQSEEEPESERTTPLEFYSNEAFETRFGPPPWKTFNEIMATANLDYTIDFPRELTLDAKFHAKLKHTITGAEVPFGDLSSGEKVLMSLVFALYSATDDTEFPKLVIMDEPDAHLHPSMAKQFLDVINDVLVEKKGVRVIITTHSPSTVALAPEESIFVMNKEEPRIAKRSKDAALRLLTSGVPTLSVQYKNRRQVFVESSYDVEFYEALYGLTSPHLEPAISLDFMSSGVTKGGPYDIDGSCALVYKIVDLLADHGNPWVFGIVDYDLKNASRKQVRVLGEGARYSLESYLFDPVLVALFVLLDAVATNAELGLGDKETYRHADQFTSEKLQDLANHFVAAIQQRFKGETPPETTQSRYVDGRVVQIPTWYAKMPGHDLELLVKQTWGPLGKYAKEKELKAAIIAKVLREFPGLVPDDFIRVFREIQNGAPPPAEPACGDDGACPSPEAQ